MQSVLEAENVSNSWIVNILILELETSVTTYLEDLIQSNTQHG